MYKCEICGEVVGPRVPLKRKVLEIKEVVHHDTFLDEDGRKQHRDTPGTQIVKEAKVCKLCYEM